MSPYELFSVLLTIFGGLFGILQSRKLKYLRTFQRESHNLGLFRALSDKNHRLQMAAAAVLIERIIAEKKRIIHSKSSDHVSIIRALISVTKDAPGGRRDYGVSPELSKFIADHVPNALRTLGNRRASRMRDYDWQGARLDRAWWPGIDAREVDFFGAQLNRAGMRGAKLVKTVLKEASLRDTTLVGADLSGADLREADLRGANLEGANLSHAKLQGAIFDDTTIFPRGFNPLEFLMVASIPGTAPVEAQDNIT